LAGAVCASGWGRAVFEAYAGGGEEVEGGQCAEAEGEVGGRGRGRERERGAGGGGGGGGRGREGGCGLGVLVGEGAVCVVMIPITRYGLWNLLRYSPYISPSSAELSEAWGLETA